MGVKMNDYKINYVLKDGTKGVEIVSAANRIMAINLFSDIAKSYNGPVEYANCYRIWEV